MKMLRRAILFFLVVVAGAAIGFAQATDTNDIQVTIGAVQLIEIENGATAVSLSTVVPINAGDQVVSSTNSAPVSRDLYYTLLATGSVSTVTASLDSAFTTLGEWHVELTANTQAGQGSGSTITLTGASQDLITGIGSVATTRVNGSCPSLDYDLVLDTPASLTISTPQTRTLTLTLNNL